MSSIFSIGILQALLMLKNNFMKWISCLDSQQIISLIVIKLTASEHTIFGEVCKHEPNHQYLCVSKLITQGAYCSETFTGWRSTTMDPLH